MKKGSVFLILIAASIFQFACNGGGGETTENSNSANSAANSIAESDSNAQAQETPLPQFTDANAALEEGKRRLDANETEKSIEAFQQAVRLDPDLADAYFNMGIAQAQLEDEKAKSVTVDEESPTPTPSRRSKSKKQEDDLPLTESQKAFAKAAEIYEKITEENPKDDFAFYNLGRSYNKLNKDEEAEKAFKQAVKLKPDDADYLHDLGKIHNKLSHYDEAMVVLKKAISIDPNNLQIQKELDKAEAGERRIKFGTSPTPQSTQAAKPKDKPQRPTPQLKIEDAPIRPRPTP